MWTFQKIRVSVLGGCYMYTIHIRTYCQTVIQYLTCKLDKFTPTKTPMIVSRDPPRTGYGILIKTAVNLPSTANIR